MAAREFGAAMFFTGKLYGRVLSALTLVASVVLALLPAGQLPRVAGPCGQALCMCRVPVQRQSCSCKTEFSAAPRAIVFSTADGIRSVDDGLSFTPALDFALVPETADVPFVETLNLPHPCTDVFEPPLVTLENAVPPPRI